MRHLCSAAAIAALLSSGCSAPTDAPAAQKDLAPAAGNVLTVTRLRAEPYSFAYYSGMSDSVRLAIRDAGQWQQAWSDIGRGSSPGGSPPPQVDFAHETVIVAALGSRATGGYGIYVDSAYEHTGGVEVVIRKVSPGARCATTQVFTQPVDVARIPVSGVQVQFRERSTVHDCG
jgi:hypothetical protein